MTCCASGIGLADTSGENKCSSREIALASKDLGDGLRQTVLSVPQMHCAACIRSIEKALSQAPGVQAARANLSMRRVVVNWHNGTEGVPDLAGALARAGYASHLPTAEDGDDEVQSHLVRALAVAGFCSMNIMLLSVSVWAGADAATRHMFQLLSSVLALPAVVYSGSSFYASAWRALSRGRLNMDVPISAGVLLSFGLSLYDAVNNTAQAYFEAATSLLFVLLAGRILDQMVRRRARSAVSALARCMPRGANVVTKDREILHVPLSEVRPGMRILIAADGRVPTDGIVAKGRSEVDRSFLTGESAWCVVDVGCEVRAGELNRGDPFEITASVAPQDSLISDMSRMLASAEDGRAGFRNLADRAAALYAPAVHGLSVAALVIWYSMSGDIHRALTVAISVLVITCPCALGLAVPMVQVVLTRRLFARGIMATDGTACERLAEVDVVVFDKTGTLTTGHPRLLEDGFSDRDLAVAGSLAWNSRHPFSIALTSEHARRELSLVAFDEVAEISGFGLEGRLNGDVYRLGRPGWSAPETEGAQAMVVLSMNGAPVARFRFGETVRLGARNLVRSLQAAGIDTRIMSGDTVGAVSNFASELGVSAFEAGMLPTDKVLAIDGLRSAGRKILMVGDGTNDAPALRASHVSMAPSSASELGRSAADFVFLRQDLSAVAESIAAARTARSLVRQSFALAAVYNAVSLPFAFLGYVTPLMAAVAMSTSSLLVVLNALRLDPRREPSQCLTEQGQLGEEVHA